MSDGFRAPPRLADGTPPATPEELLGRLAAFGIRVVTHHHPPVFTVEEARARRGDMPGGRSKSLFLRNKKGMMWLYAGPADLPVDLRRLGELAGARTRLSFGSDLRLMRYLGVRPGAVSPFAVINDRQGLVRVVIDRALLEIEPVNLHPLDNTMTTSIAAADLLRFLETERHPAELVALGG